MSDQPGKKKSKAAEPASDPLVGSVLGGRYRIDSLLGTGAMGSVYRAEHVLMHKPLAVKILHAQHTARPELLARFEREATAAANIDHPNVVAATDFGTLPDGTVYLALELVQGKNLRAEVAAGPLPVRRALHIARQIAAGLAAAHAQGIVHRDLKPENVVLLEKNGDPDFVKVLDFGIAKVAMDGASPLTKVGMVLGTRDYMAPEQALGQAVDPRADLYSLGVVLYEMLCRDCPFEGASQATILGQQLTQPPPPLRTRAPTLDIPADVEALVMKLLAKERAQRPESASAVVEELDRLIALQGGTRPPVKPPPAPRRMPSGAPVASATSRAPGAPVVPRVPSVPAVPAAPAAPAVPAAPAAPAVPAVPAAPVVNKPTFVPGDPLPSFTFPPLEQASRDLRAQVEQAARARAPLAPAPASAAGPAPSSGGPVPSSAGSAEGGQVARGRARALVLFRRLESQAKLAIEVAVGFIDDNLRVLPAFLRRPLRRIPSVVILLGLVGFLVLVVVLIVLLASGTDNDVRKESSRVASVSAAPAPPQAPSASGAAPPAASHAAASREAVALAEQELKAGNLAGVVKAIEAALAVDPAVRENARVAQILGEAARRRASSGTAFRLLTGPMREEGATVVYDLAAGAKTPDELRAKAEEWLGSEAFRQVAPPPLAIAAELRTARGCKAKRALLERAAAIGDARTLDYLKILAIEGGCGRRGREDCFPCLREDDALAKTMATIQERLTQTPKAP